MYASRSKAVSAHEFGVDPLFNVHNFLPNGEGVIFFDTDPNKPFERRRKLPDRFHNNPWGEEHNWSSIHWLNPHTNQSQNHIRRSNPNRGIKKLCNLYFVSDEDKADRKNLIRIDPFDPPPPPAHDRDD